MCPGWSWIPGLLLSLSAGMTGVHHSVRRKITEVQCHSRYTVSRAHFITMTFYLILTWVRQFVGFSTILLLHYLKGSHYVRPSLSRWMESLFTSWVWNIYVNYLSFFCKVVLFWSFCLVLVLISWQTISKILGIFEVISIFLYANELTVASAPKCLGDWGWSQKRQKQV
jgi:hypothetical protein